MSVTPSRSPTRYQTREGTVYVENNLVTILIIVLVIVAIVYIVRRV